MKQYLELLQRVLDKGVWKENRTGIRTKGIIGAHMQFDLREGFPLITTKKMPINTVIAEMLGFWRGYDNAAQFRHVKVMMILDVSMVSKHVTGMLMIWSELINCIRYIVTLNKVLMIVGRS